MKGVRKYAKVYIDQGWLKYARQRKLPDLRGRNKQIGRTSCNVGRCDMKSRGAGQSESALINLAEAFMVMEKIKDKYQVTEC